MKGPDFLGRRFGRKRTETLPSLTLEGILGRALGSGEAAAIEAVDVETADSELRAVASGVTSAHYAGRDKPDLVNLYPDSFLGLPVRPPATPGAAQEDAAL